MTETAESWAEDQLARSGLSQAAQTSVRRLMDVWHTMRFPDDEMKADVIRVFTSLTQGHAVALNDPNYAWFSAQTLRPRTNDVVRVRKDAYPINDPMFRHNGAEGTVIRISRGTYVVSFGGSLEVQHFRPDMLETRRAVQ